MARIFYAQKKTRMKKTKDLSIGQILAFFRKKKGWDVNQLMAETGLSQEEVVEIEKSPNLEFRRGSFWQILAALDISVAELFIQQMRMCVPKKELDSFEAQVPLIKEHFMIFEEYLNMSRVRDAALN